MRKGKEKYNIILPVIPLRYQERKKNVKDFFLEKEKCGVGWSLALESECFSLS